MRWAYDVPCQHHPLLFFAPDPPEPPESPAQQASREHAAVELCLGCRARAQCLETALATRQHDGIWGGLTPRRRRQLTAATGRALLVELRWEAEVTGHHAGD